MHPTSDAAFRLPLDVRPLGYDAALSVDLDGRRFSGELTLRLELGEGGRRAGAPRHRARGDARRGRGWRGRAGGRGDPGGGERDAAARLPQAAAGRAGDAAPRLERPLLRRAARPLPGRPRAGGHPVRGGRRPPRLPLPRRAGLQGALAAHRRGPGRRGGPLQRRWPRRSRRWATGAATASPRRRRCRPTWWRWWSGRSPRARPTRCAACRCGPGPCPEKAALLGFGQEVARGGAAAAGGLLRPALRLRQARPGRPARTSRPAPWRTPASSPTARWRCCSTRPPPRWRSASGWPRW